MQINIHPLKLGIFCAIFAALLNSTAGIFSKILLQFHSAGDIVFAKCLLGFILVAIWLCITGFWKKTVLNKWLILNIAVCSFFGMGAAYLFEILALKTLTPPVVILCLMGASTITTLFLGHFWLKDKITLLIFCCIILIFVGLFLMIPVNADIEDITALLFALLCGFCYGMFLILAKRFAIPAGISYTGMLVGFGALYLVPMTSASVMSIFSSDMLIYLIPLALIPTIFGYYFTTKALNYTSASTVQIFEVMEPIFSALLAFLVLGELMVLREYTGAALIILALFIFNYESQRTLKN